MGDVAGIADLTGLVRFGARYDDPNTARWTQQDSIAGPIANPLMVNGYAYVGNEPCNDTDPSGTSLWSGGTHVFHRCVSGVVIAAGAVRSCQVGTTT
jgi:RHS repeat-associated protein